VSAYRGLRETLHPRLNALAADAAPLFTALYRGLRETLHPRLNAFVRYAARNQ
jgi:hypothetical protein